jgi:peptidoglycan/xylan/chitin deacetylase (PgdA/CDA1 family)
MLCITGDVHHSSLKTNEQIFLSDSEDTEVRIAARFVELLENYGIKYTCYVTGKTLAEEWEDFCPVAGSQLVEIGGHTYEGLPRGTLSKIKSMIFGKPTISHSFSHGRYAKQKRDVKKMIEVVKRRTGETITSWRSHGLVRDENTYPLLKEAGIRYISDSTDWKQFSPTKTRDGLISHPINVIMDHDHIYHVHRNREYVERQKRNWTLEEDPTTESYTIGEWAEVVKKQVREGLAAGGLMTVLMHPVCMYTSDKFKTAGELLEFFSQYKTICASEIRLHE